MRRVSEAELIYTGPPAEEAENVYVIYNAHETFQINTEIIFS